MTRRNAILALGLAVVLIGVIALAAALGGSGDDSDGADKTAPASEGVSSGLERFYSQKLSWEDCGGEAQCTSVEVPTDYEKPDGDTLELKVKVVPAKGRRRAHAFRQSRRPGRRGAGIRRLHGLPAR